MSKVTYGRGFSHSGQGVGESRPGIAIVHTVETDGGMHAMESIDRNDPYAPVNSAGMDSVARNDPYSPMAGPPPIRTHDAFYYFRVAGSLLGIVLVLTGVYFAAASFIIVREIVESPQRLNAYLDEWYIPLKEPATLPAAPEPEKAGTPEADAASAQSPAAGPPPVEQPPTPPAETPPKIEAKQDAAPKLPGNLPLKGPLVHKTRRDVSGVPGETSPASETIKLLTDALTRGGLPRLAGSLIVLLLVSMLIRIPFGLIKAGAELVRAMLPDRSKMA